MSTVVLELCCYCLLQLILLAGEIVVIVSCLFH